MKYRGKQIKRFKKPDLVPTLKDVLPIDVFMVDYIGLSRSGFAVGTNSMLNYRAELK